PQDRRSALLSCWAHVRVQSEEVGRVISVLQRNQALPVLSVGCPDPRFVLVEQVVKIERPRRERLHHRPSPARPTDGRLGLSAIRPYGYEKKIVLGLPMGECRFRLAQ